MLVQEPLQAAIWHCLNHYAYNDAIFFAEMLKAECENEETIWLLATCYYRSGKPHQAYALLKNSSSPQCKFLLAKCCVDLQKMSEAESVLTGGEHGRSSLDEVSKEFGDSACFALMVIATVCFSTDRHQRGVDASRKALRLNPFLWSVFEQLCRRGDRPDPSKTLSVTAFENITNITGPTIGNCFNWQVNSNYDIINSSLGSDSNKSVGVGSPVRIVDMANLCTPGVRPFTPEVTPVAIRPKRGGIRFRNVIPLSFTPLSGGIGVAPLDYINSNESFTSTINTLTEVNDQKVHSKRLLRKETPLQQSKPIYQSGNNSPSATANVNSNHQPNVRRSSRLFSNNCAVKENTKSPNRNKFPTPKSPSRKAKSKISKQALTRSNNCSELNDKNSKSGGGALEIGIIENSLTSGGGATSIGKSAMDQAMLAQRHLLEFVLLLMREFGQAFLYLSQFECKKAIESLRSLPANHQNTGWALTLLGKAYFELADYKQACRTFSEVRKIDPERCSHMEIYSTALWHLRKEAALSALAQDLVALDKHSPEAWCAAGNCYSLQKEHDVAIKFFQRAVQVDPNFAYAFTLLGHEYVVTEELDKGMSCFRTAVKLDTRHYNAWYGIGTIYSKQEKFQLAELHFKRALTINPNSCVLMCHIGVVQLALQRKEDALETLNKAIALEPNNPLCKFHRASILTSCNRHQEALQELDQLQELVPKESLVFYLTGKVHKKLGNTHLALMNFSWATDLDPKGASNQLKEAIDPTISHSHDIGDDSTTEELLQRTPPQEATLEQAQESDESFL